ALSTVTEVLPTHFALSQNYPNPFNPTTKINVSLPSASEYSLTIYNVSGQKVHEFTGQNDAGVVTVEWEASSFASGIYFYKLVAGDFASTKKMLLLK
ncbi:MAG: T9SS type A sorting domain-containing protein, partial [Candidatus Zixiibacteriota bacterium]